MSDKQQTLKREFTLEGKGLHTGATTRVTVRPAEADHGYRLRLGDEEIPLSPPLADGTRHRTVIQSDAGEVHTVEHLLAPLFGLGVDNALIEVEGGEVPGLDGSARTFAEAIDNVGIEEQDAPARLFRLERPVSVAFDNSCITAFPSKDNVLRVTYVLHYPESRHAQGVAEMTVTPDNMREEISPCRTFVMKCHAEKLLEAGLGQGADTENTVVLDGEEVVDNSLRFPDECARHKILDVVGDLALVGRRLGMHVVAYKSGHALNINLAKALMAEIARKEHPKGLLDIRGIESTLPHRYPFLLVDRVLEIEPRRRILAYKNVTRNEEFFQGHFPGQPIMPGVLQVEAMAQTGGILMMGDPAAKGKLAVLMGVESVKYRRPVIPGDQLLMEVVFEKFKGRVGVVNAKAIVDGDVVTEAKIKFALVNPDEYT